MKRTLLLVSTILALNTSFGQQGLEKIIVEKYYVTNAADSIDAATNGAIAPLRVGSVTYRVYADLLPDYKFIQMFGSAAHQLKITTTEDFYNDPSYGATFPQGISVNNTKKNTTLIDTWLSVGGICTGKMGVLKTEDTDGTIGNNQSILANTDASIGAPIMGANGKDGIATGSPVSPNVLGITTELDVFDQTKGNSFVVNDGAIAALGGVAGVTASNTVLLGQFTTFGQLKFELNIQIGTPTAGESQLYVAKNPTGSEMSIPTLTYASPISSVGVNELANNLTVSVFPNPSSGNVFVEGIKASTIENMRVVDMNGKETNVSVSPISENSVELETKQLTPGVYVVVIATANELVQQRFVKL